MIKFVKKSWYPVLFFILFIILAVVVSIFFLRLINPRELDDINPEIPCNSELYNKTDVLWIIPKFNNTIISDNKEWCFYIIGLNKSIGMHGVTHEYNEFSTDKTQEYLNEGIRIFNSCFGKNPEMFKPPQLKISENNRDLIKNNNIKLKNRINQMTHKVYHCNDSDTTKNWVIDLF